MQREIELFSVYGNYAIVKLPERKFPGVMMQGDTFHILCSLLEKISQLPNFGEDLKFDLADTLEQFGMVKAKYEKECFERGLALPYE